ncbi:hypothetical protein B0H13DRAFT_2268161 [Mycena leptocephala]|nr:hypothetical protein B0H13DRAFT_2268161 [Mycena leptocephala]
MVALGFRTIFCASLSLLVGAVFGMPQNYGNYTSTVTSAPPHTTPNATTFPNVLTPPTGNLTGCECEPMFVVWNGSFAEPYKWLCSDTYISDCAMCATCQSKTQGTPSLGDLRSALDSFVAQCNASGHSSDLHPPFEENLISGAGRVAPGVGRLVVVALTWLWCHLWRE